MFKKIWHGFGIGLKYLTSFILTWYIVPFVLVWVVRNSDLDEDEFVPQYVCYAARLLHRYTLCRWFGSEEDIAVDILYDIASRT